MFGLSITISNAAQHGRGPNVARMYGMAGEVYWYIINLGPVSTLTQALAI